MSKYTAHAVLICGSLLLAIAIAIAVPACRAKYAADAKVKKGAAAAACLASDECQNRKARYKSFSEPEPVQSTFGKWFFQGDPCSEDCSGHVAGYRWAERIGATKEAACEDTNSPSFAAGCLSFVENYEPESAHQEDSMPSGDEYEACGRYQC